jgi:hypothetical protein
MLNLKRTLYIETYSEHSYVVNPSFPDKIYHTRDIVRVQNSTGQLGVLSVRLEEIDPETKYVIGEDVIIELNTFVNKFKQYVEPNVVKPVENEQEQ